MSYFQSESMVFCQAIMPRQTAWDIMDMLGRMDCIHIVKSSVLPAAFENPFSMNLKRCDATLAKIRHIRLFLDEFSNRKLQQVKDMNRAFREFDQMLQQRKVLGHLYLNQVEEQVTKVQDFLVKQKKEFDGIRQARKKMILNAALVITLSKCTNISVMQGSQSQLPHESHEHRPGEDISDRNRRSSIISKLQYKCGLMNRKDQMQLKRIIFRISHGNAWVETFEIEYEAVLQIFKRQSDTEFVKDKLVFMVVYQTGQHNVAEQKINRVLNGLDCYVDMSKRPDAALLRAMISELEVKREEHNNLEEFTREGIANYLDHLYQPRRGSECSYLSHLELFLKKEKVIYEALSSCTSANNFLLFNTFIPISMLEQLKNLKTKKSDLPSLVLSEKEYPCPPPTLFPTCQMMEIPQEIVNTYGFPAYKQFNPAPLYLMTFGFFVGVMFGDVGHMLLGVVAMLYFKPNKWWWTLIFWMGFCGVIYGQFFGLNLGIFQSCYQINDNEANLKYSECVCIFGLDPIWKVAQNRMAYTNSYKMKLAVILGVVHMTVGILIRGINSWRKNSLIDIFTIVVPQILFMLVTFIYMDFLIIFKWLKNYTEHPSKAPSIINTMIAMVVGRKQHDLILFEGERQLEKLFLVTAICLVPILLLAKPIAVKVLKKKKLPASPRGSEGEAINQEGGLGNDQLVTDLQKLWSATGQQARQQDQSVQEMLIHQLIQTIQFVLGTVSNTASYLRLWALSLAHTQLAEVFFDMGLKKPLMQGYSGIPRLTASFILFLGATFGVLFCMDVMECFLHSLRLHWVQFQNKFYKGSGYPFKAYSFKQRIKTQI